MITRVLVGDAVREFLGQFSIKIEDDKRIEDFKFILEKFTEEYYGGYPPLIEKVTTEDIALYFNYLQGCQFKFDPYRQDRKPPTLEPVRFEQAKKEMFTFWKWAAERYDFSNPYIPRRLANDSKRIPPVSEEDIRRLVHVMDAGYAQRSNRISRSDKKHLRDIVIVLLLIDTGIRAEEISRLTVKHADLRNREITIRDVNDEEREIPIGIKLTRLLNRYIIRYFTRETDSNVLLIPEDDAVTPMDRNTIQSLLFRLGKEAEVKNLYALRFRALFASYYQQQSLNEEYMMRYLGIHNKRHLRLYIEEREYKIPSTKKTISIMDKWDFQEKE